MASSSKMEPIGEDDGDEVLYYLETLRLHQLLEQMVCTAFRASSDTLNQTNFGGLKQMATDIEQLHHTMASTLTPLHSNHLSGDREIIEVVRRLCVVFEHVEKLLTLAAYLYRSVGGDAHKESDSKLQLGFHEREYLVNMFTPPANQSWRKVLSTGNLLNGDEPIQRKIFNLLYTG